VDVTARQLDADADADADASATMLERLVGPRVVEVSSPVGDADWDRIVAEDPSAMADHARDWFVALLSRGPWRDASRRYVFDDGSEVLLPLARRGGTSGRSTIAAGPPASWGFGGPVGRRASEHTVVHSVMADLASLKWLSIRLRGRPETGRLLADVAPPEAIVIPRRAHLLDLDGDLDEVFARMRKSTRRMVRRMQDSGSFVVTEGTGTAHLDVLDELRSRSIERWASAQGEPMRLARWRERRWHQAEIMRLIGTELRGGLRTWVASIDGRPAAVNVMASGPTAHIMRSAIDRRLVGSSGIMQYLDWLAIERAKADGSHTVNLGESGTSSSLARYKEGLGARPADYTELRLERYPVTAADTAIRRAVKRVVGFRDPT
jgi:hypothetical protein